MIQHRVYSSQIVMNAISPSLIPNEVYVCFSLSVMGRACLWMNILVRLTADSNSFLFVFFKNKTKNDYKEEVIGLSLK